MKTILMTGAGGFAGKNLKPYLEEKGFKVSAARSKDYDFTDFAAVSRLTAEIKPSVILHFGFYGIGDSKNIPADILPVNLKILNNFIKAGGDAKIFTLGSGAEFDKSKPVIKAKESDLGKNIPADLYGYAKYQISREIEKHPNVYNLRLFGLYGPYESKNRFITHAVSSNLARQAITMRQDVVFDYLYIKDFCRIIEAFINNPPKERFINLTPGKSISLTEICAIINSISGYKSEINAAKGGFANEYTGDNTLLKNALPSFAFTSYETGIKDFFGFLEEAL